MDRICNDKENNFDNDYDLEEYQNFKMMMKLSDGIFHDFKNILTNISGLTQLSMLEAETQELRSNLNSIYKATSEFRDALNRYQKMMKGNDKIEKVPNQLNEIINKTISMVRFRFIEKDKCSNIKLVTNIHSNIKVLSNSYDLNQTFLNIIMNSIDAMEEKGGILTMCVYNIEDFVCVSIKDTGVGIPENDLKNIFEKTFTTKVHGSGLGLKIAKATIEDHGGSISIKSVKDKGTEVNVLLPIYKEHDD